MIYKLFPIFNAMILMGGDIFNTVEMILVSVNFSVVV